LAGVATETDLIATGLLDSLALVDLLVQLEQEFDVQINLDDLEIDNFRSVRNIAAFIHRQRGGTGRLRLAA
jgi:acyl carrier protein